MSLLAILDAIRESGEAQVREIGERTNHQIHEMQGTAGLEAKRVAEEVYATSVAPAIRERARILHHARLEALQITGNEREALVDETLEQTREDLKGLRADITYPAVLRGLTNEALRELDGSLEELSSAQLNVDPRDKDLMEKILSEIELTLKVIYNLDCWGGLIAKSQDGRVVVINTLEARLERATPYLRRYLANFFECEQLESKFIQVVDTAIAY